MPVTQGIAADIFLHATRPMPEHGVRYENVLVCSDPDRAPVKCKAAIASCQLGSVLSFQQRDLLSEGEAFQQQSLSTARRRPLASKKSEMRRNMGEQLEQNWLEEIVRR